MRSRHHCDNFAAMASRIPVGMLAVSMTLMWSCGGASPAPPHTPAPEGEQAATTSSDCAPERSLHRGFRFDGPGDEPLAVLRIESSSDPEETFGVCPGDALRTGWSVGARLTASRASFVTAFRVDAGGHAHSLANRAPIAAGASLELVSPSLELEAPSGREPTADGVYGIESLVVVISERPLAESDAALDATLAALASGGAARARLSTRGVPVIASAEGTIELHPDAAGVAVVPFWWALVVGGSLSASSAHPPEDSVVILTE